MSKRDITIDYEYLYNELETQLREYLSLMESEPANEYIKISEVYHHLKRMIGDE